MFIYFIPRISVWGKAGISGVYASLSPFGESDRVLLCECEVFLRHCGLPIVSGSKVGLTTTWCCAIPCNVALLPAVIAGDMLMLSIAAITCLV